MTTRAQIVTEARRWIGTPFQHQAALRGIGADCIGLVAGVAFAAGILEASQWQTDPLCRAYSREPNPGLLAAACNRYMDSIAVAAVQYADVLLFAYADQPMHFGIVSGEVPLTVIHAYAPAGSVVENVVTGKWRRRVTGAFRFRGIT